MPFPGTNSDPKQAYELIVDAAADLENLGEEDVRGVPTTHYRVQVDPKKLAEQLPADRRPDHRPDPGKALPGGCLGGRRETHPASRILEDFEGDSATLTYEFSDLGVRLRSTDPPKM